MSAITPAESQTAQVLGNNDNNTTPTTARKPIPFGRKLDLPTVGTHRGTFADLVMVNAESEQPDEAGTTVRLTVRLQSANSAGQPFLVSKDYNWKGRGRTSFRNDINAVLGEDYITEDQEEIDPSDIIGKPLRVETERRKTGKEWEAVIKGLLPVEAITAAPATTEPALKAAA